MIKKPIERYFFNPSIFKVIMIVAALLDTVPVMHQKFSGYLKFILLYGILICAWELFQKRFPIKNLKSTPTVFLISFVVAYVISIGLHFSSGLYENISQLCYMVVFFCLFFIDDLEVDEEVLKKELLVVSYVFVGITFVYAAFAFWSYASQVYILYQVAPSDEYFYMGFADGRLWGFLNPNMGAVLNVVSILFSVFFILKGKNKIFPIINIVIQYFCLILTDSRTSNYAFIIVTALLLTYLAYLKLEFAQVKRIAICALICILIAALLFGLSVVVEKALFYVPGICVAVFGEDFSNAPTEWHLYQLSIVGPVETKIDISELFSAQTMTASSENLARVETSSSVLSGREYLWSAALKGLKSSPIFGVTYGNIQDTVIPLLADCDGVNLEKELKSGGLHNGYITVLLASGILGFALIAAFVVSVLIKPLKKLLAAKSLNANILVPFIIAIFLLIVEVFESHLLYRPGISNIVFWMLLGYLYKFSKPVEVES